MPEKMHDDEVDITPRMVRALVASQHPKWSTLAIEPVLSTGTDNAMYRLGDDMSVRLPRRPGAVGQTIKEQQWLPLLAPHLPAPVPVPLGHGEPGHGYPFPWSVCRWVTGENPDMSQIANPCQLAADVADVINALQLIDATGAPHPNPMDRGMPLADRDGYTRAAIAQLEGTIDTDRVVAAWEADLKAPAWTGPRTWIHGDLSGGNLLVADERLSGVIDFGLVAGDPACELQVAWNLFDGDARRAFRDQLQVDDAMWARGRGWALSVALVYIPYYEPKFPERTVGVRRLVDRILEDHDT